MYDFFQGCYTHMWIYTHILHIGVYFFQLVAGLDQGKGARTEGLLRSLPVDSITYFSLHIYFTNVTSNCVCNLKSS